MISSYHTPLPDLNSADGHIVCWLADVQFLGNGHVHRPVSKLLAASEVIAGRQRVSGTLILTIGARFRLKWDEEQRKHAVSCGAWALDTSQ